MGLTHTHIETYGWLSDANSTENHKQLHNYCLFEYVNFLFHRAL